MANGPVTAQSSQSSAGAWYACVLMTLCFTFAHMDRTILTLLVAPIEHEFKLSDSSIGLLIGGAFAISYAVLAVPFASLADRGSRVRIIALGLTVWCIATLATGLARTPSVLFIARIAVAAGEAVLVPAAASLLADYFAPEARTRALSVFGMGPYLGGGLALMVGGALYGALKLHPVVLPVIGAASPWRLVLIILGAVGLFVVPLVWTLREPTRAGDHGKTALAQIPLKEALQMVGRKGWALTATMFGFASITLAMFAFHAWSPTLFIRDFGWNVKDAGLRLGLFPLILGPIGALTGAALADMLAVRGRTDGKLLVGLLSTGLCAIGSFVCTLPSLTGALLGMGLLQLATSFNYGVLHAALVELLPNRLRAQGVAVYTVLTAVFSMTLGPLAVGLLTDRFFHDPSAVHLSLRLVVPAAFVVAGCVLALGLRPYRRAVADDINVEPAAPSWPRPVLLADMEP